MNARITAVFTQSGLMARRLSALRPEQRIVALTTSREVQRELALIWGVESLITEPANSTEEMLKLGEETLLQAGMVTKGELIVAMAGRLSGLGLSSSVTLLNVGGGTAVPGEKFDNVRR
jgi:pyruvate kinase